MACPKNKAMLHSENASDVSFTMTSFILPNEYSFQNMEMPSVKKFFTQWVIQTVSSDKPMESTWRNDLTQT